MYKLQLPGIFRYKKSYLKHDVLAAIMLAMIGVPSALAFAVIAGLPPETGLYTMIIGSVLFGLLGYSRRLVAGADSATALLLASGAALIAQPGSADYINAIAVMTLLVGALLLLLGIFRFGFLADLVSRPVMVGFLAGVGVQLILTQLPAMVGLKADGGVWHHLQALTNFGAMNGLVATVAALVIGVVLFLRNSRIPGEIIGVGAAVVFAMIFNLQDKGVEFLGALPGSMPIFHFPTFSVELIGAVLPTVLSIVVVILVQSSVMARSLANEHGDKVETNHDMMALGAANGVSALFQGFAVNGSPTRSQLADSVGMRSQLGVILSGLIIALLLFFDGKLFQYIPLAALAAIVCTLGLALIRFRELRYMWSVSHEEFVVAMVALVGTVVLGVQMGILFAVAVSLMERLRRQYRPDDAVLLRDGELSTWAADRLGEKVSKIPNDVLVYAFGESLFFENINYFVERLRRALRNTKNPVSYILIDAGAIDDIDYTAVETLKRLYRELGEDGIAIGFAHVSPSLRAQFDIFGITDIIGARNIYPSLSQAMAHEKQASALEMIKSLKLASKKYIVVGGAVLDMLHLRDTHNVDLVVAPEVYDKFAKKKHWREVVLSGGKRILVHEQYTLMKTWMGSPLVSLKKDMQHIEGIPAVSIQRLIDVKHTLGRRKDLSDIELLRGYLRRK